MHAVGHTGSFAFPDDWAFTVRMDVPWQSGALEDSGWSAELSAASCPAGVAVLYPPCARLELLQLHTPWRKGQAQGSPDAQLHGDSLPRHEEGDDLTNLERAPWLLPSPGRLVALRNEPSEMRREYMA